MHKRDLDEPPIKSDQVLIPQIFNRPGVAGAVLQTHLILIKAVSQ